MIVAMQAGATESQIDHICDRIREFGYAPHVIRGHLSDGQAPLVIGGLGKRSPAHKWDGRIEDLRIVRGQLSAASLTPDYASWPPGLAHWMADTTNSAFTWSGADSHSVEPISAFRQAMNDLCQVLLNSSEFFYLH